jgi:hypothetical protein
VSLDVRAWALHEALFGLAHGLGLRSFRVQIRLGRHGETIISLVLAPNSSTTAGEMSPDASSAPEAS